MNIVINGLGDLAHAANKLLEFAGGEKVFMFFGDMGAGKTTFIKSLCKVLGVTDTVSSPTYSLVNEYPSDKGLVYHFDFYRLKKESEALDMGVEEYLDSGNICLIEWPERIEGLWPQEFVKVQIELLPDNSRTLTASLQK